MKPDFSDLRFTNPDNTVLTYWVQETGSNYAVVWVKVPSIPTTGTQVYLYYGNPSAPSLSNGDATFSFYDDFNTLNPTVWSADSGSWNAVSFDGRSCAVIEPSVDNNYLRAITSDFSGTQGWIIESRIYTTQAGDTSAHPGISFYGRSGNNDHLYFRPHSDAIGVQKAYYDGTVHVQTALAGKFPWNTWNHVSVKLTGDSVQPALNGVSLGTFTSSQYDTAYDEIGLTAHTGGRNYYDWILIRKAVPNEPAHGSWGSGEVNPVPPTASFTADPQSGQTPLAVQFTDQSSMAPTTWQWDFGDGTPNSTLQNPTHTYSGTGKKTVTLTVSNTYGTSTLQKTDYITVLPPPQFLDGWSYRKLHTISGSPSGVLTDYPIRFKVYNTTGTDTGENVYLGSNVKPDFSDLRFTNPDNTVTQLLGPGDRVQLCGRLGQGSLHLHRRCPGIPVSWESFCTVAQ